MSFASVFWPIGMDRYRDYPIRLKIILILILATLFAIGVAGITVLIYETRTFKPRTLKALVNQSEILEEILIPSLQFQDNSSATDYLATLRHWDNIEAAAVFDAKGQFFAGYRQSETTTLRLPEKLPNLGPAFRANELTHCAVMKSADDEVMGYLWLNQSLLPLYARLPQYGIMFFVLSLSIAVVVGLVGLALKRSVLIPITSLEGTARLVIANRDYSLRVSGHGRDEIGRLTQAFNQMLKDIESRDQSLRQSEERFSKAFLASPVPLAIARASDQSILEMNESNLALLGYTREEVIGKSALELGIVSEPQAQQLTQLLLQGDGAIQKMDLILQTKKGQKRETLVSIETMRLGGDPCYIVTTIDLTERKQVEASLRQSQKMEAIGLLAGGIAHDFNNLLTAIIGYSSMALDSIEASHPFAKRFEQIMSAGERAAALTRQLLAYSRKQVLEAKQWDVNVIVGALEPMLKRLISENIQMLFIANPQPTLAMVDRGQIEQVVLNLVVNARDAMPEGGKLVVQTSHEELERPFNTHLEVKSGRYIVLTVSDTGIGMTPEVKARLFEPFFTTKDVGKGTGLGLSVVYGIVKQGGGTISVYSEPGLGTTFRIYFPALGDEAQQPTEPAVPAQTAAYAGRETILLVEDEAMVREFSCTTLENLGYSVLVAVNGEEGLKAFLQSGETIDLVVTDIVMPIMGGREMVQRIRSFRPDIPVLFVSGYSDDAFRHTGGLELGEHLFQKPFTTRDLARTVREKLDGYLGEIRKDEAHDASEKNA